MDVARSVLLLLLLHATWSPVARNFDYAKPLGAIIPCPSIAQLTPDPPDPRALSFLLLLLFLIPSFLPSLSH